MTLTEHEAVVSGRPVRHTVQVAAGRPQGVVHPDELVHQAADVGLYQGNQAHHRLAIMTLNVCSDSFLCLISLCVYPRGRGS